MKNIFLPILFLLSFNFVGNTQVNLEDGLVAFFPFNSNAMDESNNSNNAINIDAPQLIEGHDGTPLAAYQFNGIDDYIEFPNNTGINLDGSETFAFSLWLKAPVNQVDVNGTVNDILAKWDNNSKSPYPYGLRLFNQTHPTNGGKIVVVKYEGKGSSCNNAFSLIGNKLINDNEWHHVVFQRLGNDRIELYVDAQLQGEVEDASRCNFSNNNNLLLGLRSRGVPNVSRRYSGGIDNFRIYNRPLTTDEIDKIFSKDLTHLLTVTEDKSEETYPNSLIQNTIKIDMANELNIEKIELVNSSGQVIQKIIGGAVDNFPNGTYYLKIELDDKQIITKQIKIIK